MIQREKQQGTNFLKVKNYFFSVFLTFKNFGEHFYPSLPYIEAKLYLSILKQLYVF
jgi:hypothetical protein